MFEKIYIPNHPASGASNLLIGLVVGFIQEDLEDRNIVVIGNKEYYSGLFTEPLKTEKILFLDDTTDENIKTTKALLSISKGESESTLYVFASNHISPRGYDFYYMIFKDFRSFGADCLVEPSCWSVFLPPLFCVNQVIGNLKEAGINLILDEGRPKLTKE